MVIKMKIKKIIINHNQLFLTILFITLSSIIFGILCFHNNIWYDEAYTMVLNRHNFKDLIYYVKNDTNGPLFPLLLKLVTSIFNDKLYVGRLLSLFLFNIQFIIAFYPLKRLFNIKTSLIYSCLILLSFFSLFCSIEIRLYSLSMMTGFATTIYAFLYLKDKKTKDLIFYTLFGIMGIYSHNYTTIAVFLIQCLTTLIALIKKDGRKIIIANITIFMAFLPWIGVLFSQEKAINGSFWIQKPNLNVLIDSFHKLISFNNIICIILLITLLFSFIGLKKEDKKESLLMLFPGIMTIILFVIFSLIRNPLFVSKYITAVVGIIYLFIAIVLGNTKFKYLFLLYLLLIIPNFINLYKEELYNANDEPTKEMVKFINENIKGDKVFYHTSEDELGISEYYFPNSTHYMKKDVYMVVRKPDIYGDVTFDKQDIDDEYIIVLFTLQNNIINNIYELRDNYNIINHFKTFCSYNGGYELYILKNK